MIECGERQKLQQQFELAVVAALTEDARLNIIKLPSDQFGPQLARSVSADKKEHEARTAYTEHIKTHRCLD